MGKINHTGVLLGGLVAGIVLVAYDFLMYGVVLRAEFEAAMQAIGKTMDPNAIYLFVVLDLLFGVWFVWLYAMIRPRYGPGPRTALIAGLFIWVGLGVFHALGEWPIGIFTTGTWVKAVGSALLAWPLATIAGAKIYSEPAA
jgi:hypothetical protein